MEYLESLVKQLSIMQWSDFLDIIVVAFLIYKLLPLFRSTGTARIAKGVVGIILVAWITDAANLYALNFIINQLLAVGLIAIVVLFQPELRRILDHLGSMKLRRIISAVTASSTASMKSFPTVLPKAPVSCSSQQ